MGPRISHSHKKGDEMISSPFVFSQSVVLRSAATELTLIPSSVVAMDEPFASRAIEQLCRGQLDLRGSAWRFGFLECSPQGGTLRTVAHGRRARLTHVLLGGCDIRHENYLQKTREFC